ncbi:MAG: hypothetical protein V4754_00500 [Pseudomonadota bacterium]
MKLISVIALALFALSPSAQAAGKTASNSFQVSFVVNEACAVQSGGASRPVVSCQFASPSHVTQATDTAPVASAAPAATTAGAPGRVWVVTF